MLLTPSAAVNQLDPLVPKGTFWDFQLEAGNVFKKRSCPIEMLVICSFRSCLELEDSLEKGNVCHCVKEIWRNPLGWRKNLTDDNFFDWLMLFESRCSTERTTKPVSAHESLSRLFRLLCHPFSELGCLVRWLPSQKQKSNQHLTPRCLLNLLGLFIFEPAKQCCPFLCTFPTQEILPHLHFRLCVAWLAFLRTLCERCEIIHSETSLVLSAWSPPRLRRETEAFFLFVFLLKKNKLQQRDSHFPDQDKCVFDHDGSLQICAILIESILKSLLIQVSVENLSQCQCPEHAVRLLYFQVYFWGEKKKKKKNKKTHKTSTNNFFLFQLYMTLIAIALFIIPACIIAVCYGIIINIIWSKSKLLTAPPKKSYKSKANGAYVTINRTGIDKNQFELTSLTQSEALGIQSLKTGTFPLLNVFYWPL